MYAPRAAAPHGERRAEALIRAFSGFVFHLQGI
jgi:hypothetical protein